MCAHVLVLFKNAVCNIPINVIREREKCHARPKRAESTYKRALFYISVSRTLLMIIIVIDRDLFFYFCGLFLGS